MCFTRNTNEKVSQTFHVFHSVIAKVHAIFFRIEFRPLGGVGGGVNIR